MTVQTRWTNTADCRRCEIIGELDLSTAPGVRKELIDALNGHPDELIVDLADVSFIDSTGLRALLSCHNRARELGVLLLLAGVADQVMRTLEIANLTDWFEFVQEELR